MHLEGLSHRFTIIGTIIAICLFIVAIIELYHFNELVAQTQQSTISLDKLLNKTDNLLTEMEKSTTGLTMLVNKTDQLIKVQTNTSSNISQQTILKEYNDEKPFKAEISYCNYEADDKDVAYSIVILDKNGDPVTLKFMLIRSFAYYTLPIDNGIPVSGINGTFEHDANPELIEPNEEKLYRLQLANVLNQTMSTNDTYLFIRSQYDFAAYSDATENLITKYAHDAVGQQMIEFKKDNDGNWELYPNQNSICK